jgi:hypothetical protein
MPRDKLRNRRLSENFDVSIHNQMVNVQFGYDDDMRIKEIFVASRKFGSDTNTAFRDIAVLLSFLLQYGCSMQEVIDVLSSDTYGNAEGIAGALARLIIDHDTKEPPPHVPWREKVAAYKEAGGDMSLEALLELSKSHTMSAEESEEQRRSWVIGELMLEHPDMTREEANQRYDQAKESR